MFFIILGCKRMESQGWWSCSWDWCQPKRMPQLQQWALPSEGCLGWNSWAAGCCQAWKQEPCWWNQGSPWPAWRWWTLHPWAWQAATSFGSRERGTTVCSWRGWSSPWARREQGLESSAWTWPGQTGNWPQDPWEGRGVRQYQVIITCSCIG